MKLRVLCAVVALTIGASLAEAQMTTADGIDAFLRGDYERAAEILHPLAGPVQADPVAALFVGMLYESGRGVPRDVLRACALYSRAEDGGLPFISRLAEELLLSLRGSLEFKQFKECDLLAAIGFDHGVQPLTFSLGPGHSVTVDVGGATITYQGKESHIDVFPGIAGIVILPARHTALSSGRSPVARNFLEFFTWAPNPNQGLWSLNWLLFEVIGDDFVPIADDILTTSAAAQPPIDLDTTQMTRVRVNDAGDAEWAVLTGPNQQSEIIETEAERQEAARQSEARQAAERAVDWTRVLDPYRRPTLTYADATGCAALLVYGWSADRSEIITMRADKSLLQLSTVPRTLDLASQGADYELLVHVFERPVRSSPFCNDVRSTENSPEQWRAIGGTVTIEVSPPGILAREPSLYRATIRIVGAEFVNATGGRVKQLQPIVLTALVGGGYVG